MRISTNFKFLELVNNKRNRMLLRILAQLIKYIIDFAIRCIDFYAKKSTSIIIL